MQETSLLSTASSFLRDGGEMGERTRNYDWSKTSIGAVGAWPVSLRGYVNMVLSSRFPMLIFWGPELLCFYNDAFRPSLGDTGKHPGILGMNGKEAWTEVWEFTGPLIERILKGGEAAWFEDQSVPIYRNGKMEDVYWTFSYSPLTGDDGTVAGVLVTCTETTKTIKALNQLQESEKRFRTLADQIPQFIWMTGPTGIEVTYVNKSYLDFLGLDDLDAFLGGVWQSLIHPDDLQTVHETYSKAEAEKKPYSLEARYKNANSGIYHWFLIQGQSRHEPDGTYAGFVGTLTDITSPKEASDRLKESEARFRNLLQESPMATTLFRGPELIVEIANELTLEYWGKTADIIGKPVADAAPELEAQDLIALLQEVYQKGDAREFSEVAVTFTNNGLKKEGYYTHKLKALYDQNGAVESVLGSGIDVTEQVSARKQVEASEARLRSLIEEAPVATCLFVGREMKVEIANDRMLGYWGKEASVIGLPLEEAVPELKGQPYLDILDNVFTTGQTYTAKGARAELNVGGVTGAYYYDFTYKPLFDTDGKVYGIMDMAVDVTDQVMARHRIEQVVAERTKELAAANLLLEQNNRELEQFAYIASHDLQEPLRKVSTFAEMLKTHLGQIDERSLNYFQKITASTHRMMELIRDVLNFSQLSNQQQVFEEVDMGALLETLESDFELVIEQKGAVVTYHNLPTLTTNHLQMRQLFGNLLSNALKFTQEGITPKISIASQPLSVNEKAAHKDLLPDVNYCLIDVEDNGIGFGQEHADKIFSIFQRLHGKSEFAGTGIGLALCKKIVQNHHGEIWATSTLGKGAAFHIILPC